MLFFPACESGTQRGQKRLLDLLELELQTIVGYHVDAENRTQVHWNSNQYSSSTCQLSIVPSHVFCYCYLFDLFPPLRQGLSL